MRIPIVRLAVLAFVAAACRSRPPVSLDLPELPFAVDSSTSVIVADGVIHRFLYAPSGPWAIHVLEARADRCWSVAALKSSGGAVGRATTLSLVRAMAEREPVAGGVNADFFLFAPPGVPVGMLMRDGNLIAGPIAQPALVADSSGRIHIGQFAVAGHADVNGRRVAVRGWNRAIADGLAVFDSAWGATTDSASGVIEVVLAGNDAYRVVRVDTATAGVAIPADGAVLRLGPSAADSIRMALVALHPGMPAAVSKRLLPFHPREAVGGRPVLLRGGAVAARLDTVGRAGFAPNRHPRTAAGISRDGARILLVTVDGRQAPYSDGMSLQELAVLMQALGAAEAVNLDGGGSTAMVVADGDGFRVANRPSDGAGERPVGNAVALVRRCER